MRVGRFLLFGLFCSTKRWPLSGACPAEPDTHLECGELLTFNDTRSPASFLFDILLPQRLEAPFSLFLSTCHEGTTGATTLKFYDDCPLVDTGGDVVQRAPRVYQSRDRSCEASDRSSSLSFVQKKLRSKGGKKKSHFIVVTAGNHNPMSRTYSIALYLKCRDANGFEVTRSYMEPRLSNSSQQSLLHSTFVPPQMEPRDLAQSVIDGNYGQSLRFARLRAPKLIDPSVLPFPVPRELSITSPLTILEGACTVSGETFFSPNYPDPYDSHSNCKIQVNIAGILRVEGFTIEGCCDFFGIQGPEDPNGATWSSETTYYYYYETATGPDGVHVFVGDTIIFTSDEGTERSGFEIRLEPFSPAPTHLPSLPPSSAPTIQPTPQPTQEPTPRPTIPLSEAPTVEVVTPMPTPRRAGWQGYHLGACAARNASCGDFDLGFSESASNFGLPDYMGKFGGDAGYHFEVPSPRAVTINACVDSSIYDPAATSGSASFRPEIRIYSECPNAGAAATLLAQSPAFGTHVALCATIDELDLAKGSFWVTIDSAVDDIEGYFELQVSCKSRPTSAPTRLEAPTSQPTFRGVSPPTLRPTLLPTASLPPTQFPALNPSPHPTKPPTSAPTGLPARKNCACFSERMIESIARFCPRISHNFPYPGCMPNVTRSVLELYADNCTALKADWGPYFGQVGGYPTYD